VTGGMSSPEELTFVIGRRLRQIVVRLHVVRRQQPAPHLAVNRRVQGTISDSDALRSTAVPKLKVRAVPVAL